MKIIESADIFNVNVNQYLEKEFNSDSEYLYLFATNSVFKGRKKFSELSPYFDKKDRMFVSEEFESYITNKIRSAKGYLPIIDMYYILKKVIDDYFKFDDIQKVSFQNIHYKLFELYKLLMFHDIDIISEGFLKRVDEHYSKDYFYVFDIYNRYKRIIN